MTPTRGTSRDAAGAGPGLFAARPTRQAAVAELGRAALTGLDVAEVFELAVDLLRDRLDVDLVKILHQPGPESALTLVTGRGWDESVEAGETTVPCDLASQAGYTLLSAEPIIVGDLASETRFVGPALLVDHGVVSGMSVVIPDRDAPYGVLGVHTRRARAFTEDDADFMRSVANIVGGAVQNARSIARIEAQSRSMDERVGFQKALAECASALLASRGSDRLRHALEALLHATQATYVFVEHNVMDPDLGFCSKLVAEVEGWGEPETEAGDDYWDLVPWDRMPMSRAHLECGEPFVVRPDELEGPEYEQYAADPYPVKSELNIPIFVNGEWHGLIGVSDSVRARDWPADDISLLTTAAAMIGAYWERDLAREALEDLVRFKDDFLASVSHELRTPLTAMVGFGRILHDDDGLGPEERREFLDSIVRQGVDLTNIVNDLLVAAKASVGKLEVSRVPVGLRAQLAQVLEDYDERELARIVTTGNAPPASGDPARIRQIVRNLVSNALRYGGNAIRVVVGERETGPYIIVADDGPPIPVDDRERIFDSYERAHHRPGLVGSLGLGLVISRQLARLMGGDVVYRHEGGESVFELSLLAAGGDPEPAATG